MAHAAWLRLVARDLDLQRLPVASFHTQTRSVRSAGDEDELADLVSVFLTPEAALSGSGVITESDRGQVLDAVIDYGGELLIGGGEQGRRGRCRRPAPERACS
jgi:hypothetical protein